LASSERLIDEMFPELERFFQEIVKRGAPTLKEIILSKGNNIKFREKVKE
jgi:hypothetical protein